MPSYDVFVVQLLENASERLMTEMTVLTIPQDDIHITHNSYDKLIVYASKAIKAYIPKKYEGFPVEFVETHGGQIEFDLDAPIDFHL